VVTRDLAAAGWYGQVIPADLVMAAAADHCLAERRES
jgi:hypothetical protein